jgi:hypothetical protein
VSVELLSFGRDMLHARQIDNSVSLIIIVITDMSSRIDWMSFCMHKKFFNWEGTLSATENRSESVDDSSSS